MIPSLLETDPFDCDPLIGLYAGEKKASAARITNDEPFTVSEADVHRKAVGSIIPCHTTGEKFRRCRIDFKTPIGVNDGKSGLVRRNGEAETIPRKSCY